MEPKRGMRAHGVPLVELRVGASYEPDAGDDGPLRLERKSSNPAGRHDSAFRGDRPGTIIVIYMYFRNIFGRRTSFSQCHP